MRVINLYISYHSISYIHIFTYLILEIRCSKIRWADTRTCCRCITKARATFQGCCYSHIINYKYALQFLFFIKCNYRCEVIIFCRLLFDPEKGHVLKTQLDCIMKTNLCLLMFTLEHIVCFTISYKVIS